MQQLNKNLALKNVGLEELEIEFRISLTARRILREISGTTVETA